jgi:hypothetical protein
MYVLPAGPFSLTITDIQDKMVKVLTSIRIERPIHQSAIQIIAAGDFNNYCS